MLPAGSGSPNKLRTVLSLSQLDLLILTLRSHPSASFPSSGTAVLCLWRLRRVERDRCPSAAVSVTAAHSSHRRTLPLRGHQAEPRAGGTPSPPPGSQRQRLCLCKRCPFQGDDDIALKEVPTLTRSSPLAAPTPVARPPGAPHWGFVVPVEDPGEGAATWLRPSIL